MEIVFYFRSHITKPKFIIQCNSGIQTGFFRMNYEGEVNEQKTSRDIGVWRIKYKQNN